MGCYEVFLHGGEFGLIDVLHHRVKPRGVWMYHKRVISML
jgi:hypothetical protein